MGVVDHQGRLEPALDQGHQVAVQGQFSGIAVFRPRLPLKPDGVIHRGQTDVGATFDQAEVGLGGCARLKLAQEGGLADPGLALEQDRMAAVLEVLEEDVERHIQCRVAVRSGIGAGRMSEGLTHETERGEGLGGKDASVHGHEAT